jgi:CDP-paratose 2-epimerase
VPTGRLEQYRVAAVLRRASLTPVRAAMDGQSPTPRKPHGRNAVARTATLTSEPDRDTAEMIALVTGSSGLVGSELVTYLDERGWTVHGIDNNMRLDLFGEGGDTTESLRRLRDTTRAFTHHALDIRDRDGVHAIVREHRPQLIVHAAAQPSHDLAARRPRDDFEINALATLDLLEAARQWAPESPFVFLSTNKVYGDSPNGVELVELETRWDYADPALHEGIDERFPIDRSLHSLFGVSKASADLLVQEYGLNFGLPTVCFRAGCLTGSRHAAVELHGFLAYLARALRDDVPYRVYGHKGKQVRDNLHARDVAAAVLAFAEQPRTGAVYNLGGGRANSVSMLEAIARLEELMGKTLQWTYVDEPRQGDHICYISDVRRFRADYPGWDPQVSLDDILGELASADTR